MSARGATEERELLLKIDVFATLDHFFLRPSMPGSSIRRQRRDPLLGGIMTQSVQPYSDPRRLRSATRGPASRSTSGKRGPSAAGSASSWSPPVSPAVSCSPSSSARGRRHRAGRGGRHHLVLARHRAARPDQGRAVLRQLRRHRASYRPVLDPATHRPAEREHSSQELRDEPPEGQRRRRQSCGDRLHRRLAGCRYGACALRSR